MFLNKKGINNYPLVFKIKVINYYKKYNTSVKDVLDIFAISKSSLFNWIKLDKTKKLQEAVDFELARNHYSYQIVNLN